jgi:hypothetical protein
MPKRRNRQLSVNSATVRAVNSDDVVRSRLSMLESFGSMDAKRPAAWTQFGYRESLTFADYFRAYERFGPANGAVHRILDLCWQDEPRIKQRDSDDETPWEEGVEAVLKSVNAWAKLRDFDRRNMVGRYAGLIYRMADGRPLSEPLVRATRLVDLIPVYEDQIKVAAWDGDPASETYGKPSMWQYRMRRPGNADTQGAPDMWADVHPSRVQILSEGSVGDFLDGTPLLRAGFNHLVDLEKISGGSAESFLKNSARHLVVKFDANASPQVITQNPDGSAGTKTVRQVVEDQTQSLNRNIDSSIVMQGGEVTTLQTQQSDPQPAFTIAANQFASSVRIPYTILFGQQTGRLASDQDIKEMQARCKSRREAELTPMLEEFVKRMQAAGVIEAGEFEIEWDALDTPGDDAKASVLGKMTAAMKQAFDSGLSQPLFDANELRSVMDYEPLDIEDVDPTLPDLPDEPDLPDA